MQGALAVKNGVLYVGRHAKTASVCAYDLDGHALETSFTFKDERVGRSTVSGLAIDEDRRVWVADRAAGRVRCFSLFGQELFTFGGEAGDLEDRRGRIGVPVDVCVAGCDDELQVLVASDGLRRHALQWLHAETARVRSLAPQGDPRERFDRIHAVASAGRFLYACESRARRIQVYRDGEFHFLLRVPSARGDYVEPVAVAGVADGRVVVAVGGPQSALLLMDRAGRVDRVLAGPGSDSGCVSEPGDVDVEEGASDRTTRVVAIDRDGERVQVFTLEGTCYGAFEQLDRA